MIDFFVRYDELEEIPQVKNILVNNIPICLLGSSTLSSEDNEEVKSNEGTQEPIRPSGISLQDLSLENFASVTQIPQQVNNVSDNVKKKYFK